MFQFLQKPFYKTTLPVLLYLFSVSYAYSQPNTCTPTTTAEFKESGSASKPANGFLQITPNTTGQYGQAWSNSFYDFSQPFSYNFSVYLGSNNAGGDGLAFVMRPAFSPTTGVTGGGLGYHGMTPSLALEFDTFQNTADGYSDPAADHIALHNKGRSTTDGRIVEHALSSDIENNAWHDVIVTWTPTTNTFKVNFDGVDVINLNRNILNEDLNKSRFITIGFTASTGAATNLQSVCSKTITGVITSNACPSNSLFKLTGHANIQTSSGGYIQLTPNTTNRSGQAWSNNQITLASNFNQKFRAFFGNTDAGADGFAFVFRSSGTDEQGINAEGLGYGGISPSFAIEFDTYQNSGTAGQAPYTGITVGDIGNDHTAFHRQGNYTSTGRQGNNVDLGNIEDNAWHDIEIDWNATTKLLSVSLDGILRNSITRDIVKLDFLNNPLVYFGFTASTGGSTNEQAVCIQEVTATIPASLGKTVAPASINDGGVAVFTWSVANTAPGAGTQSGIAFTDTLPASLRVAATPAISFTDWLTNPMVTATPGSDRVTVSGGSIAAGSTAGISVSVTNVAGQSGSCPLPAFTNSAARIGGLSNNLNNSVGAGPCLSVNSCAANAGSIIRN